MPQVGMVVQDCNRCAQSSRLTWVTKHGHWGYSSLVSRVYLPRMHRALEITPSTRLGTLTVIPALRL